MTAEPTQPPTQPPTRPAAYPLRLRAELDPQLGQWTWLVKWLLALPHVVVLAFLWLGAALSTVVALFAILLTGRYPRGLFDYVVGVLRWTWRVTYYGYSVLGTDRYPPFSLRPDPSYPADLEVDPPGELSRGKVLVKWWLLALPQYVVVGVIDGGLGWHQTGLVGILSLVAVVTLAFRGSYPQHLFDLTVGLNRWTYRVAAYALLLRDEYPPFRLDQGGDLA